MRAEADTIVCCFALWVVEWRGDALFDEKGTLKGMPF
jgi:hypothetical protein